MWIAGVLALALFSYGIGVVGVSPGRASGREFWHAFLGKGGTGYAQPVGRYYVVVTQSPPRRVHLDVCPVEEVEACLPGVLASLQPVSWYASLLEAVDPESPPSVADMERLSLHYLTRYLEETYAKGDPEKSRAVKDSLSRWRELPHDLRWKVESQALHLALELGAWGALLLLLLGTRPPGQTPPLRAGVRASLFAALLFAALWGWLSDARAYSLAESPQWAIPFTAFELHGVGLATLPQRSWGWARVAAWVLLCGGLATFLSWAWNRPRPRSLLGCGGEACLLGLPAALGLWWLSGPLLAVLERNLPAPPLVPFSLALPASLLCATSACALALRLQLAPPRELPGEREPLLHPVALGEREVPWWRRTLA